MSTPIFMPAFTVKYLSDTELAQMFSDYVNRMEDKERHTEAACKEVDAFDTCCASEFPNNHRLHSLMCSRMMDVAVEYEESGFIAGFKTAIALLCGQEELLPTPTHFPTPKEEKPRHKEISKPQGDINFDFISTKTIAAMFATSNWKVVNRIEKYILPECSEQECKGFFKCTEKNEQRKMVEIYKLNHEACKIYIKYMSLSRKYVNVSAGIGKMEEMMQAVFFGNGKTVSA